MVGLCGSNINLNVNIICGVKFVAGQTYVFERLKYTSNEFVYGSFRMKVASQKEQTCQLTMHDRWCSWYSAAQVIYC